MILTAHEYEQKATVKLPLTCNGNCNQGRACDCTANVDDDLPPRPPMLRHDPLFLLLAAVFSVGVVYLAAMGALPYALALGRWIAERLS